ncbi:beta-hexosaminidase subunit beta [Amyelois transitella]|uniref:beta-hexosaminidase subunit beta n=1 Tax=Amyelois transitella TaxID=680683 RepID=UPI0029903AD4|nr:beta-hexosaminidase subunit beta [Amyelois transitella]
MISRVFFISVFCAISFSAVISSNRPELNLNVVNPGSRYPPTKGEVWPKPQFERKKNTYYLFKPSQFHIRAVTNTCDILKKAIERYSFTLRTYFNIARWTKEIKSRENTKSSKVHHSTVDTRGTIQGLDIYLTSPCEDYPYLGMDESYDLTVNQTSSLTSNSIWGILRGLETFSHLFYLTDDSTEVRINRTVILDYPRYHHRGLLLDTSRHFISLNNIKKTLNAMSMNKMNVFHWHIVDDESFPYQSERYPEISARGAFHPLMVYSKADIQTVIEYATERGIRVVPEFDVPGHTRSWGESYPSILTKCYRDDKVVGLGPMDPTNNDTYTLLRNLIAEIQEWFPDKYFHVGGDEVDLNCWSSNPDLIKYMEDHNIDKNQLHGLFMEKVIPLLKVDSTAIVWQEVFDEGVPLNKDVLVQVWKNYPEQEMAKVLKAGHKVLFSSSWYLDHITDGWKDYYQHDPRTMLASSVDEGLKQNVIGGEACMWGEMVDDSNVISRVWPRASAVAERLWSPITLTDSQQQDALNDAVHRLEEHACRMNRRGVAAQPPNGPGKCVTFNNL